MIALVEPEPNHVPIAERSPVMSSPKHCVFSRILPVSCGSRETHHSLQTILCQRGLSLCLRMPVSGTMSAGSGLGGPRRLCTTGETQSSVALAMTRFDGWERLRPLQKIEWRLQSLL